MLSETFQEKSIIRIDETVLGNIVTLSVNELMIDIDGKLSTPLRELTHE